MKVSFRVLESENQLSRLILGAIKEEIDESFKNCVLPIRQIVQDIFKQALENDMTWQSLKNGKLRAEFGLPDDVESRLGDIMEVWANGLMVDFKLSATNTLNGSLKVYFLDANWQDVLSQPAASIITKIGQVLPWLEWLLIHGDKIIVREYRVLMKSTPASRSGMAIMVKKGRWRVPPEFSGITNNNFITRLIDNLDDKIMNMIQTTITSKLG